MTVPHDEQPLTRRQLRELERQKPRKQQKEEAKAAEEAEASRRAQEAARVDAERAAFEAAAARAVVGRPAVEVPEAQTAAPATSATPDAEQPVATAEESTAGPEQSTAGAEQSTAGAEQSIAGAGQAQSVAAPAAPGAAPAPILSRRARRALSADHPLAEQQQPAAAETGDVAGGAAGHPEALATGPIIAELVHDEPSDEDVVTVEPEAESTGEAAGSAPDGEPAQPMVEELMVVDEYVTTEGSAEDEEELAEIDDTPEPEPVHIVTLEETPSAPVLAPLFQAPTTEREQAKATSPSKASFDDLIALRGVGASNSVASTSALVLPSVPNHGDVGTALDETGEVIITGSIDLPMSLGSTGAAPADGLESSELDTFLDPESEVGSDVAPVSATRAVSTHGPSSGLVAPPKRRGSNAPVILAITAGVLAVGVVGLLLAAFVFRIF